MHLLFYQQKIEWVRLKREHPEAFEEAKRYEKTALEHGSPFTWSDRESLSELERPERAAEIEADYEVRLAPREGPTAEEPSARRAGGHRDRRGIWYPRGRRLMRHLS